MGNLCIRKKNLMTAPNREIQATTEHNYARWRHCFVSAFFVATLGVTADAQPLTFNDPTPAPPGSAVGDAFGFSVALDGNHVLIGASRDDTNGVQVGQAHLFDGDPMSPTFGNLLWTFDDPTPTPDGFAFGGDAFGWSVAIDGGNVLVGARQDDTNGLGVGQAHLFDGDPMSPNFGDLLQTFDDPTPTPGDFTFDGDNFGNSVGPC